MFKLSKLRKGTHFCVNVSCARRWKSSKFTWSYWLTNRYGRWKHSSRWLPNRPLQFRIFVQWMLLIMAKHFKYYRLSLYIFQEWFGGCYSNLKIKTNIYNSFSKRFKFNTYILYMIKAKWCSLSCIFNWFGRESFVMSMQKAEKKKKTMKHWNILWYN